MVLEPLASALHAQGGWVHDYSAALLVTGFPADNLPSILLHIEVSFVKLLHCTHSQEVFTDSMSLYPDPQMAPSSGVILTTYPHWFQKPIWACSLVFPVAVLLPPKVVF